jgi:multidrug efflux system membrane fusion protein
MDVIVGVPEDKINSIRQMTDVKVKLWANSGEVYPAKLRELSPIADPVTRTFVAKIALPDTAKEVRLGMTASVSFGMKSPISMIPLPLTALLQEKNISSVWVVESGVVRLVPVQIASTSGEDILISGGIQPGQTIVTAGVNLLKAGQKVRILGVESVSGVSDAGSASGVGK